MAILNDIMDISKIESGLLTLACSGFELDTLVRRAIRAPAELADKNGITLTHDIDASLAKYYEGDAKRIGQIITNLTGNAVKFSESGEVKVSVQAAANGRLRFSVSDTGPGIPKDQLSTIFERFRQLDGSHSRKHGGTGLGLPICRELVKAMNGKLGVRTKLGVGSEFWFELPLPVSTDDAAGHLIETGDRHPKSGRAAA